MIEFLKKPWVIFSIALPYFFCMNNYLGIRIDGVLYTLQVIHRWFPERFVGDPPFVFGNQDSFTIFSPVYGFLMSHMPVDVAAMVVTLVIQLLFAIAMILFVRAFARKFDFEHWTLPLVIAFFTIYISGSDRTFIFFSRLVEPYPVPRSLAVAFGIMGLAAIFSRHKWITPVLALIGSAFHPLMAGWVLPVWMFYHFPKTRIPIVVMSALFPLAGYIGVEPFAGYPDDWYYKPLKCGPWGEKKEYIFRFAAYVSFFILLLYKFKLDKYVRNFLVSVAITAVIAFYWYLWTGINNFILLYQFQVWRMEWLCIVASFILFAYVLYDAVKGYRETHRFTTKDLSIILMGLTLFSDIHAPEGLIVAMILLLKKNENVTKKHFLMLGLMYALLNLLMAAYCYMLVMGAPIPYIVNFSLAHSFYSHYMIMTAIVCLICGVSMLCKKDFLRAVIFLLYLVFPQLLLLPIVALAFPFLKRWQVVAAIALIVVDGVWGFPMRTTTLSLSSLEKMQFIWTMLFVAVFAASYYCLKKNNLRISKALVFIPILCSVPYAVTHWDQRPCEQKIEESNLDQFKRQMAFPQIKERGRVFYYVNGYLSNHSRLQFLGGSYADYESTVGEVFSKNHFDVAENRCKNILYKNTERNFISVSSRCSRVNFFFTDSLSKPDILIDRTRYLCSLDEISHLVSDFDNLPFAKQDSLRMNVLDKNVYLYECPQQSPVEVSSN